MPIVRGVDLLLPASPLVARDAGRAPVPAPAAVLFVGCGEGADAVAAEHVRHAAADDAVAVAIAIDP